MLLEEEEVLDPKEPVRCLMTSPSVLLSEETSFITPEISSKEGRFCASEVLMAFKLEAVEARASFLLLLVADDLLTLLSEEVFEGGGCTDLGACFSCFSCCSMGASSSVCSILMILLSKFLIANCQTVNWPVRNSKRSIALVRVLINCGLTSLLTCFPFPLLLLELLDGAWIDAFKEVFVDEEATSA